MDRLRKGLALILLGFLVMSFVAPVAFAFSPDSDCKAPQQGADPKGPVLLAKCLTYKVGEFATLSFLYGDAVSSQESTPLWGILRILYGVLVFALMFAGLSFVPGINQKKNVVISIAAILAVLSVIATPTSIFAAFASTYASVFAFIILGIPIAAGCFLLLGTPTKSKAVAYGKSAISLFMLLITQAIMNFVYDLGATSKSPTDGWIGAVTGVFSNWISIVWLIMIGFVVVFLLKGLFWNANKRYGQAKGFAERLIDRNFVQKEPSLFERGKLREAEKRTGTSLLNEYLQEEQFNRDFSLVTSAWVSLFTQGINNYRQTTLIPSAGALQRTLGFTKTFENALNSVVRDGKKWKKNMRREYSDVKELVSKLQTMGLTRGKLAKINALEGDLLKKFSDVENGITQIKKFYDTQVKPLLDGLPNFLQGQSYPYNVQFASGRNPNTFPRVYTYMHDLNEKMSQIERLIHFVDAAEDEALEMTQSLIEVARENWYLEDVKTEAES